MARQEFAGYWEYLLDDAIFTAPAHPSWGGAALVGEDGKLIGIGSLRLQMSRSGEIADINMVVPIDLLPPILDDLVKRGRVDKPPRPWLGAFSAESNGEVIVMSVSEGSPAAQAGLQQGDIISDVRDAEVEGLGDFYRKLWAAARPAPKSRCGSCATAARPGCASRPPTAAPSQKAAAAVGQLDCPSLLLQPTPEKTRREFVSDNSVGRLPLRRQSPKALPCRQRRRRWLLDYARGFRLRWGQCLKPAPSPSLSVQLKENKTL